MLVWVSCWLKRRPILMNRGGLDAVSWFGVALVEQTSPRNLRLQFKSKPASKTIRVLAGRNIKLQCAGLGLVLVGQSRFLVTSGGLDAVNWFGIRAG